MSVDPESFNSKLYGLIKVRGYKPVPLNSQNQRTQASETADVIEGTFNKDGEDFGKFWVSIDDTQNLIVYYDNEQEDSPDDITPGVDYDDTWTGFLKLLKSWAQRRQLNFELSNKDRLSDDMRQREHYKMKEKLGENKAGRPIKAGRVLGKQGNALKPSDKTGEKKVNEVSASKLGRYLRAAGDDRDDVLDKAVRDGSSDDDYDRKRHTKRWNGIELAKKKLAGSNKANKPRVPASLEEGYYPMGKKASYNDSVPNVKIVLQHSRAIEEGEQRYRNVAKIFVENTDGERFLVPTNKPGVARVYARHIAEGGVPNDDRWNHIKGLCEEYKQMAGFARATRTHQFNESVQALITEGLNHYNKLRENLSKLTGHRGYTAYFEAWTPTLMEDEGSEDISEMFMSSVLDPRIESVMPILSRLHKNVMEVKEVSDLSNWADDLISETMNANDDIEEGKTFKDQKDRSNKNKDWKFARKQKKSEKEHDEEGELVNETAWEKDLQDNEPRVVHGYKGVHSKPFKKKFRNQAAQNKWMDSDDFDHEITHVQKMDETRINEDESTRPYVCVHAKKGKCQVEGTSSYDAAKKAAAKWGLKNTAGIDAYLSDITHKTSELGESFSRDPQGEAYRKWRAQNFDDAQTTRDLVDRTGDRTTGDEVERWLDNQRKNNEVDEGFADEEDSGFDYDAEETTPEDESFYVYIGNERGGFVGEITKEGGKWRETSVISGNAPYAWGNRFMGYLSPGDIIHHLQNDYKRSEVHMFNDADEAMDYYNTEHEDITGDIDEGLAGEIIGGAAGELLAPELPGSGYVGAKLGGSIEDNYGTEIDEELEPWMTHDEDELEVPSYMRKAEFEKNRSDATGGPSAFRTEPDEPELDEANTGPKITARKHEGDDAASWAVFVDGKPFVTGLTQREVAYYKNKALSMLKEKGLVKEADRDWTPTDQADAEDDRAHREWWKQSDRHRNPPGYYDDDDSEEEVDEGLDANQRRAGQLGPTSKVRNNNIGKLVGANESIQHSDELKRILDLTRFRR